MPPVRSKTRWASRNLPGSARTSASPTESVPVRATGRHPITSTASSEALPHTPQDEVT